MAQKVKQSLQTQQYSSLKYCILERLEMLPHIDYKRAKKELIDKCEVSRQQLFYGWFRITKTSSADIPAQKLDVIAKILGCRSDDLKNYII